MGITGGQPTDSPQELSTSLLDPGRHSTIKDTVPPTSQSDRKAGLGRGGWVNPDVLGDTELAQGEAKTSKGCQPGLTQQTAGTIYLWTPVTTGSLCLSHF